MSVHGPTPTHRAHCLAPAFVARKTAHGYFSVNANGQKALEDLVDRSRKMLKKCKAAFKRHFTLPIGEGTIARLDTRASLCSPPHCLVLHNGESIYFDKGHITKTVAITIRHMFGHVLTLRVSSIQTSEGQH